MEFTQQILGFSWQGEEKDLKPFCRLQNLTGYENNKIVNIDLTLPYEFNWVLSDEYFCPGYTNEEGLYHPCPTNAVIEQKYDHCKSCSNKDGFKQAFFFGGEANARMEKHLAQDHFLYLAFFHPRTIKVGTAAANRKYKRLIEQDALISTFIAEMPGTEIQKLERLVSQKFGFPESVSQKQKTRNLKIKPNASRAKDLLNQASEKVLSALQKSEFDSYLIPHEEQEVINFADSSTVFYPSVETQLNSISNPQTISGTYQGLRGRNLILTQDSKTFLFNTKELVNRKFYVAKEKLSQAPTTRQTSLFGWLI